MAQEDVKTSRMHRKIPFLPPFSKRKASPASGAASRLYVLLYANASGVPSAPAARKPASFCKY